MLIHAKAIDIQPWIIGYVAESVAHVGKSERDTACRACDIAFERFHSSHVTFLLFIKVCFSGLGCPQLLIPPDYTPVPRGPGPLIFKFVVSRFMINWVICERLETIECTMDARECFYQMAAELGRIIDTDLTHKHALTTIVIVLLIALRFIDYPHLHPTRINHQH